MTKVRTFPSMPATPGLSLSVPPARPLLYASIVGSIDQELKAKGLARTDNAGDLILIPAGGMEFGLTSVAGTPIMPSYGGSPAAIDATMWSGATGLPTSRQHTSQKAPWCSISSIGKRIR